MGPGDGQRIADPAGFQVFAQAEVGVDLITGYLPGGHASVQGAADHHPGQLGLGRETGPCGDAGRLAAGRVSDPGLRQIKLTVDERVTQPGPHRSGKRRPGRSRYVPPYPCTAVEHRPCRCFLQITHLVDDQHNTGITQVLAPVLSVGVADCGAQIGVFCALPPA